MKESTHNFLLNLIGVVLALFSLVNLVGSFGGESGMFWKLLLALFWFVCTLSSFGFLRRRGWAFLFVSVGLLAYFMIQFIRFVLAFDSDDVTVGSQVWPLLLVIALIGYLGREKVELRFRPELDHH